MATTYLVLVTDRRAYSAYKVYRAGIRTRKEAIAIAKRYAKRRHDQTKVTRLPGYVTVWESYRPDFVRRE
ncbi:MAG TPA: hypothetical protein VGG32_10585 [Thermoplasmata archaeon]|jgi:hypothetical protein